MNWGLDEHPELDDVPGIGYWMCCGQDVLGIGCWMKWGMGGLGAEELQEPDSWTIIFNKTQMRKIR